MSKQPWVFGASSGASAREAADTLAAFASAGYVIRPDQFPEIDAKLGLSRSTTMPLPKTTHSACPYCGTLGVYAIRCPNCGAPRRSIGEIDG